jgi:hypothetical protein
MVVARQTETGQKFTAVSNSSGEYLFAQLPVGGYAILVSAANFKQSALPLIEVHTSDRLRRDFTLEIGDRTEVVTVQIEAGGVQLESAEIRDVIEHQQVVDLPVKGRQFLDLAMLSPGVVRPPGGTRGDAMQQAGNLVNVLGQRSGHNLYLMDGVAITDEHFNNMVIAPSFRAEAYNLLNHPNFNIPGRIAFTPNFGTISSAQDSRQLTEFLNLTLLTLDLPPQFLLTRRMRVRMPTCRSLLMATAPSGSRIHSPYVKRFGETCSEKSLGVPELLPFLIACRFIPALSLSYCPPLNAPAGLRRSS